MYSATDEAVQHSHHIDDIEALWFYVNQSGWTARGCEPCLQVSQRFESLWQSSPYREQQHFPSFVSFVGGTGVGKSTLVRAMMMAGTLEDMRQRPQNWGSEGHWLNVNTLLECRAKGPVTRAKHATLQVKPTSEGVHLYQDLTLQNVQYATAGRETERISIFLADCEGFKADTTKPSAARSVLDIKSGTGRPSAPSITNEAQQRSMQFDQVEADDIRRSIKYSTVTPLRAPYLRKRGKEGSELFYARHLYAFSDVVLFVTDKLQSLGSELRSFLQWIAKAEERDLPSTSPRTLIIVVNKSDTYDEKYYDEGFLMHHMFQDLANRKIWESSDELKALKDKYDSLPAVPDSQKITDNMSFFKLFFYKVRICYIPRQNEDTAERLYQQYLLLRNMIIQGSTEGQRNRSNHYSRYDAATVAHLLNKAFDHFANSDLPFDFHAAARKDNLTPISLAGHIAYLLRHTGFGGRRLQRFVDLLSICLISYEYRQSLQAREPNRVFSSELADRVQRGFAIYEEKFQPCAFKWADGSRCTSVKLVHGHRHSHGDATALPGDFDPSLFSANIRQDVLKKVQKSFVRMYEELYAQDFQGKPSLPDMRLYRSRILGYEQINENPNPNQRLYTQFSKASDFLLTVKSHKTCFACLQAAPDHFLPCGHGFCGDCVKDFGEISELARYRYRFEMCVLCGPATNLKYTGCTIKLDPRAAGVRVLTLDGGGVRGVIEMALLKRVEERVNLNLPTRELFDLVVGTGTGGIIALGVSAMTPEELNIDSLSTRFKTMAKTVFEHDRLSLNEVWRPLSVKIGNGLLFLGILSSRYNSQPRRSELEATFGMHARLFGRVASGRAKGRATRAAVYASSSGSLSVFSNYSRDICEPDQATDRNDLGADQGFVREDDPSREPKIWEAAMATSAAPGYFGRWRIDDPKIPRTQQKAFTDGGLQVNMPLKEALKEKELIWSPANGPRPLDISVSVGAGYSEQKMSMPSWLDPGHVQYAVKDYHEKVMNSENMWREFRDDIQKYIPGIHHRLNLRLKKNVELDDWKAMEELTSLVDGADAALLTEIDDIAYQLVGSLLYFEPVKVVLAADHNPEFIQGSIWCRLPSHSPSAIKLFSRIKGFYHQERPDEAMIPVDSFWTPYGKRLWDDLKPQFITGHTPFSLTYHIEATTEIESEQCVYVELLDPAEGKTSRLCRLSGFPISYAGLSEILEKRRGVQ